MSFSCLLFPQEISRVFKFLITMSTETVNYIKNVLSHKIIGVNKDLQDTELINCNVKNAKSLDGFMSDIFQMQITLRDKNNQK